MGTAAPHAEREIRAVEPVFVPISCIGTTPRQAVEPFDAFHLLRAGSGKLKELDTG